LYVADQTTQHLCIGNAILSVVGQIMRDTTYYIHFVVTSRHMVICSNQS